MSATITTPDNQSDDNRSSNLNDGLFRALARNKTSREKKAARQANERQMLKAQQALKIIDASLISAPIDEAQHQDLYETTSKLHGTAGSVVDCEVNKPSTIGDADELVISSGDSMAASVPPVPAMEETAKAIKYVNENSPKSIEGTPVLQQPASLLPLYRMMKVGLDDISFDKGDIVLDEAKVRELRLNIAVRGLLQPLIVDRELNLLDGKYRLEAIRLFRQEAPDAYQRLFGSGIDLHIRELSQCTDRQGALQVRLGADIRRPKATKAEILALRQELIATYGADICNSKRGRKKQGQISPLQIAAKQLAVNPRTIQRALQAEKATDVVIQASTKDSLAKPKRCFNTLSTMEQADFWEWISSQISTNADLRDEIERRKSV